MQSRFGAYGVLDFHRRYAFSQNSVHDSFWWMCVCVSFQWLRACFFPVDTCFFLSMAVCVFLSGGCMHVSVPGSRACFFPVVVCMLFSGGRVHVSFRWPRACFFPMAACMFLSGGCVCVCLVRVS